MPRARRRPVGSAVADPPNHPCRDRSPHRVSPQHLVPWSPATNRSSEDDHSTQRSLQSRGRRRESRGRSRPDGFQRFGKPVPSAQASPQAESPPRAAAPPLTHASRAGFARSHPTSCAERPRTGHATRLNPIDAVIGMPHGRCGDRAIGPVSARVARVSLTDRCRCESRTPL